MSRRYANPHGRKARIQGVLNSGRYANGAIVYRVPVRVVLNDSRTLDGREEELTVLALSSVEAANYVAHLMRHRPETEIYAYGPKGGVTHRYVGYQTAIWHQMTRAREDARQQQLSLFGEAA